MRDDIRQELVKEKIGRSQRVTVIGSENLTEFS